MEKYTFIHPTKTGGSACEQFFLNHYSNRIVGQGHVNLCTETNNSIIIVRDVKSRFFSMFKYWKYGAIDSVFTRDQKFCEQNESKTILDFIELLKSNKEYLYVGFTWDDHFKNISHWINNVSYKNIIVIKYESNLNEKVKKLLKTLNIPDKNIELPIFNVSKVHSDDIECYKNNEEQINDFILKYFAEDIKLLDKIDNEPELFKFVI